MNRVHRRSAHLSIFLAAILSVHALLAQGVYPGKTWQLAPLADRTGWSDEKLVAAKKYSESIGSAAVMIVHHGRLIDQWGDVDKKLVSYSMRKSLLSALYGIYVQKGVIHPDATLAQMGIDDVPPLTPEEKQAKLVDLLRARSGVYHAVPFETKAMAAARPARGSHAPGTFWYYNNWDFDTLGAIFEKESGLKIGQAFEQNIARPIDMQDFAAKDVFYLSGPESLYPGYQFDISTRDLARFGLLYLRDGRWGDRQIVPKEWVAKSSQTSEMVHTGSGRPLGGYEYLWWVQYKGVDLPNVDLPEGTYSARGAGGHYVLIIPALDLVIVHRASNEPPSHSLADVEKYADEKGISARDFGTLVRMILDAYDSGGKSAASR